MKPTDKTAPNQTGALEFEIDLTHPPKKVWRALTDPELMTEWLLPVVDHKLQPGAEFQLKTQPQPGWDGIVKCRYLDIEPTTKLRWAWVVGDLDTVVTVTLVPTDDGTRLSIVQSGFLPTQKQNFAGARYGWNMMAGKLVEVLNGLA